MHCHDSLSVWWSDYFLALIRGGPQRWVSYDLYGVERGEEGLLSSTSMSSVLCRSLVYTLLNANYLFLCDRTHRHLDTWFPKDLTGNSCSRASPCSVLRQPLILDPSFRGSYRPSGDGCRPCHLQDSNRRGQVGRSFLART